MNKTSHRDFAALAGRVQSKFQAIIRVHPRRLWLAGLLLALLPLLPLTVLGEQEGDFVFLAGEDRVVILGYRGPGGAVVIPDPLDGLPVMVIEAEAFLGDSSVTSITIPDSVVVIGNHNSVGYPFRACTNLTAIVVGALNSAYSSVDGVLFNKQQTESRPSLPAKGEITRFPAA